MRNLLSRALPSREAGLSNVSQERQDLNHNDIIEPNEVTATYIIGPRGTEAKMTGNPEDPTFRWYVTDGLGSVIAEVGTPDASGNPVKSTRRYDVYGAVRSSTGAGNKQQFCGSLGHAADDDTGLTYMRARYYDPAIGRFVSEDQGRQGTNWYLYCGNSPTDRIDPTGKEWIGCAVGLVIGAVLGGISAYYSGDNVLAGIGCGALAGGIAGLIGNPALAGAIGSGLGVFFSDLSNGRGINIGKILTAAAIGAAFAGFAGWAMDSVTKSLTIMAVNFAGPAVASGDGAAEAIMSGALGGILDSEVAFWLD